MAVTAICPALAGTDSKDTAADPKQLAASLSDAKQIEAANALKKPEWLTELSVTVKESYDSNIYLTNADRAGFPKMANVDSAVTSITPKVAFNLAPLIDDSKDRALDVLSLSYAPEVVRYHEAATENYEAHRIGTQLKAKVDSFSVNMDNQLSFVDGNRNTPQYNQVSAWATAVVRERRDQMQDRNKLILRNDWDNFFVRGVGSVLYYDLNTYQHNPSVAQYAGWQNYVDRYDVNGGVDMGYKITPDFAATLGYRHGYQYQQAFSWTPYNSTNDYNRILGGFEGKPVKWLKLEVQAGPDFHQYDSSEMLVGHSENITRLYVDGTATADITSKDAFSVRVKQWQWVSSVGTASYEDKTFEFAYKRKLADKLTGTLCYQILGATYDAPTVRSDWQYTYSAGLKYDWNEHLSLMMDYAFISGQNDSDISNLAPGREYTRHLVSLGVKAAF